MSKRDRDYARLRRAARAGLDRVDPAGAAAAWWGKRGWRARRLDSIELDVRPGRGLSALRRSTKKDGSEMTNEGMLKILKVEEPPLLAFGATVVTFTDLGGGRTEMTFRTTTEASGELLGLHEGRLWTSRSGASKTTSRRASDHQNHYDHRRRLRRHPDQRHRSGPRVLHRMGARVGGLRARASRPGEPAVGAEFETGTVTIALINCPGPRASRSTPSQRRWRFRSMTSRPRARSSTLVPSSSPP